MKKTYGFTIWELLFTLLIIAVLSSIVLPSLSGYVQSRKSEVIAMRLENGFKFAQAEAMRLQIPISICSATVTVNNTLYGCKARAKNNDWSMGLLSFVDQNSYFKYDLERKVSFINFDMKMLGGVNIISDSGFYIVNSNLEISSLEKRKQNFCFWFNQKSNQNNLKSILVINKYGNTRYCSHENYSICELMCRE